MRVSRERKRYYNMYLYISNYSVEERGSNISYIVAYIYMYMDWSV